IELASDDFSSASLSPTSTTSVQSTAQAAGISSFGAALKQAVEHGGGPADEAAETLAAAVAAAPQASLAVRGSRARTATLKRSFSDSPSNAERAEQNFDSNGRLAKAPGARRARRESGVWRRAHA